MAAYDARAVSVPRRGKGTHLALLVDSPSRRAHGAAASRLALGLVEVGAGHVELVTYSDDPPPSWLPPEVSVHRLGVRRASRVLMPLVHHLRDTRPDVLVTRMVHLNLVGIAAAWVARRSGGWTGRLVLVQDHPIRLSHASDPHDNKWAAKLLYRFADGVVCPCPEVRDDIIRWAGLHPDSVAVVPNAIPAPDRIPAPPHPWLADGGPPVFVNTSNMTPWKRLDLLLEAFDTVRRRHDARLLVVGQGPGAEAAAHQVARLGLEDSVQLVGWVDDPLAFAAHAWAFVLPSDEEGFGQVLTEAMSVGCPVITTDAQGGGPRFVTDDGRYGVLVPRGDAEALAEAMAAMLRPDTRSRYSGLGLERVRAFSPTACATSLTAFLETRGELATR
jgi:glycosyltransferase involved in cell wall biosynthesis